MKPNMKHRGMSLLSAVIIAQFAFVSSIRADWLNVKTWNANPTLDAAGDGVTDDAPAVQAAINTLTNGGTLYFPAGKYLLNSTVNTGNDIYHNYALIITNGLTIKGDGIDTTTLIQGNYQTTMILVTNAGPVIGFAMDGIKLLADETSTNGYSFNGLTFASGSLLACTGGGAIGSWSKGIRLHNVATEDQGKRNAIEMCYVDDVHIEHCRIISYSNTNNMANAGPGCAAIFFPAYGADSGAIYIEDSYFNGDPSGSANDSLGDDGLVWVQGADTAVISGNHIKNFKLEAIQCAADHQTITGNVFETAKTNGPIAVREDLSYGPTTNYQINVANNVQTGGGSFLDTAEAQAGATLDAIIANNNVQLGNKSIGVAGGVAIGIGCGRRLVIANNTFDNYGLIGLVLLGNAGYDSALQIQGNSMTSLATVGQETTIDMNQSNQFFENITIMNNILSGGGNGNVIVRGATGPTNTLGQVVLANNIYVNKTNQASIWNRIADYSGDVYNIPSSTGSTNLYGYHLVYSVTP